MKIHKFQTPTQDLTQEAPLESIFELYQRVFSHEYFENLSQELGIKMVTSIFNWMVVIYGMIIQRLSSKGTLNALMSDLIPILAKFSDHKRVREKTVSSNPGGFCRARGRTAMSVVENSFDHLFETLHNESGNTLDEQAVFLIDGSSLTLESTPELLEAYPPARNQHGVSHWPIMRVVVAHSLKTGLASRPVWGPMTGPKGVSEQVLADRLIIRLPDGSTIIGDRNFGIFATAYRAVETGHPVILRMTEARAQALGGHGLNCGMDLNVCWRPSAWDRKNHSGLQADAKIRGRLLVQRVEKDGKLLKLYIFTTREDPADEIGALYAGRWHVETDLRSLKRTVRLHALSSETPEMVSKELLMGVAAYNLVRTFMEAAANKVGLESRDLSFSRAQDFVYASLPTLLKTASSSEKKEQLQQLLTWVASCKLPKRKKRRSYPRKIWLRRHSFPTYPTKSKSI